MAIKKTLGDAAIVDQMTRDVYNQVAMPRAKKGGISLIVEDGSRRGTKSGAGVIAEDEGGKQVIECVKRNAA
jgi:hypothetical protein